MDGRTCRRTFYMTDDLSERVNCFCRDHGMKYSVLVEKALLRYMNSYEKNQDELRDCLDVCRKVYPYMTDRAKQGVMTDSDKEFLDAFPAFVRVLEGMIE